MSALIIMLVRHGEKPGGAFPGPGTALDGERHDKSLIVRGWQRAGARAGLFVAGPTDYPRANVVYAAAPPDKEGGLQPSSFRDCRSHG